MTERHAKPNDRLISAVTREIGATIYANFELAENPRDYWLGILSVLTGMAREALGPDDIRYILSSINEAIASAEFEQALQKRARQ